MSVLVGAGLALGLILLADIVANTLLPLVGVACVLFAVALFATALLVA